MQFFVGIDKADHIELVVVSQDVEDDPSLSAGPNNNYFHAESLCLMPEIW